MRPYFLLYIFIFCLNLPAQTDRSFADAYAAELFPETTAAQPQRKLLKPKKTIQKINPLFYTGSILIYFYQSVISEQLQSDCTYHISCSEFTKRAIEKYGILKGTLIGINQLQCCVPGAYLDFDKFFLTNEFKVDNAVYLYP